MAQEVLEAATQAEAEMAATARSLLVAALDHSKAKRVKLTIEGKNGDAPVLEVPPRALRFFANVLRQMALRQPLVVTPQSAQMTTQQAAAFLNVLRPFGLGDVLTPHNVMVSARSERILAGRCLLGDVGIGALVGSGKLGRELDRERLDALDALRRTLGGVLFCMARDMACQRDHAVIGDHAHAGLDGRVPVQFGLEVATKLRVGSHAIPVIE
jgi:hypothetical protein